MHSGNYPDDFGAREREEYFGGGEPVYCKECGDRIYEDEKAYPRGGGHICYGCHEAEIEEDV